MMPRGGGDGRFRLRTGQSSDVQWYEHVEAERQRLLRILQTSERRLALEECARRPFQGSAAQRLDSAATQISAAGLLLWSWAGASMHSPLRQQPQNLTDKFYWEPRRLAGNSPAAKMLGFLHGQRTPRLQGREGRSGRDGHSRPSGAEEVCYIQLPRVDEGDAAAQQAIHHTQTGHPKMSASASSDQVPLLQDDGQGLMEPQLPDVTDDITKAPRRIEQVCRCDADSGTVPLVGAPAADDWEPTWKLRDSIKEAVLGWDAEGVRKALDGLSPEQAEKALTTEKGWETWGSAIHFAAEKCMDVDVFEVLFQDRQHLLTLKGRDGHTPLHFAVHTGLCGLEKADVPRWMLTVNPQLLKLGMTPLDRAVTEEPGVVVPMIGVAPDVTMEVVKRGVKIPYATAQDLKEVVCATVFLKDHSESLAFDSLCCCAVFRKLMKSRPKDSLTDEFEQISSWNEALTADFCSDAPNEVFEGVAFVLLRIESIKGDSAMTMAGVWLAVWLWGAVLTGGGFVLLESFQFIRLKAAYWEDSWNYVDMCSCASIIAFIAVHVMGWSTDAKVGSGIVIALLFALRLLQTASLHPAVGPLILAVVRMFSDISMFLCLYVYILVVFAVVFTLLSSDEDHQYFGSFPKATLTLFYAGLGEFNEALNNAIESHDTLGTVLLFTYVILSSIILASTYAAIEQTQTAQYQLLRIRVLNEYLNMPQHERLPPPFNLIAVVVSVPLRYVASLIGGRQSALCRIASWSVEAIYVTLDALMHAVVFTPAYIDRQLGVFQPGHGRLEVLIRAGMYWDAFRMLLTIPVMPLYIFHQYVTAKESSKDTEEQKAEKRRQARDSYKGKVEMWMKAAYHRDTTSPDIMTALTHFEEYVKDKIEPVLRELQTQQNEMQKQVEERLTKIEAKIK
ncbi:unnamed protein product [Vitrella brassicaformis CCMP3155]|uniref:Ion transport domain-containing protein n=1 Tax=Vitrella brassicaformis (strain CCMP3155) TaxID=1169540 RepID=A0A0G4EFA9_VITBC|nr:unnamed protein product [Vitrella brassicaformis CCMP3155]|eukprot:CEL94199.1 unnamed protein product [Vitrella brassicaformis CCMP3155]